jgi:thiamine-phosphate pyrophosphorylase
MLPELTPAVARALQCAQRDARRHGSPDVRPEHLLHGLLEEEEGRASVLLAHAGLDPAIARRVLAERPPLGPPRPGETPLPLALQTQAVFDRAQRLTRQMSADPTVGSDQVLRALLHMEEALRGQLGSLGLSCARLEAEFAPVQEPPLHLDEPLHLGEPTELIDTGRILDAAANRAREGLRVTEDYCRFVLDDALLSGELKWLRHELAEVLADLPPNLLLEARETLRDVGTTLSTAREQERRSLTEVAQANLKRLQEALRSLEEFGKLRGPEVGRRLEQLRYRSYTLERAIVLGTHARRRLTDARLCVLLTGSQCAAALDWTIREAAAGGARVFQLREKNLNDLDLLERARKVRRWTREAEALFIVNDRPDIARLVEADGVHLGQEDLPVKEARLILGPDAVIGVSTHNLDQVRQAVLDGASYLGVGPTFPSGTKTFPEFAGLDFVRQATAETSLPAFIIGGVTPHNVSEVAAAGGRRVAVSQAVCQADDPRSAAAGLLLALSGT